MTNTFKRVRFRHIKQGTIASCAVLAVAPDNLLYHEKPKSRIAFRFYDRLTGAGEWVTVRGDFRSTPRNASDAIERAYGKWLRKERIVDEKGKTGLAAVSNGNSILDVGRDITGLSVVQITGVMPLANFSDRTGILVTELERRGEYFFENHAYRVMGVSDRTVSIFNPWKRDGRKLSGSADEGILTIEYDLFAQDFSGYYYKFF